MSLVLYSLEDTLILNEEINVITIIAKINECLGIGFIYGTYIIFYIDINIFILSLTVWINFPSVLLLE
jgi:hypothetical protein